MKENDVKDSGLSPGSDYECEICGQSSDLIEHKAALWCDCCGYRVCDYDTVDHDRVQLDEKGGMTGRGHGTRVGARPSGTSIGNAGSAPDDKRRKWNRLRNLDRMGRGGPTRQKLEAIQLVNSLAPTDAHASMALDLLDLGWPDKGAARALPAAREKPIWQAGHPCGVATSAAACLHLAAMRMGFDSRLSDWIDKCLPGRKYGLKYGFRAQKRMVAILGEAERAATSADSAADSILSRAELGRTQYGPLTERIWHCWRMNTQCEGSLSSHARPVLAALCEMVARDEGVPVNRELIAERFNVGVGFSRWKGKLMLF
tara:strand:- start:1217 stop:2161 length:945 start_codon:yes stop_codon:yes gene_type:complete